MPAYQSKQYRFTCQGMCINRPIDAIPDGKFAYLYNVRSYQEGRLESRPGLESVSTLSSTGATDYIHSGITLGDYNVNSSGGSARFIGYNTGVYIGQSPPAFPDSFTLVDNGYSGNPLSFIPSSPVGSATVWLYCYDSAKQRRYSTSYQSGGVPIPANIGIALQWVRPVVSVAGGSLTGDYYYRFRFRDVQTGVYNQPEPPTYTAVTLASQEAILILPTFANPADPSGFYTVDIFRYGGTINDWRLVGSALANGGTFNDNNDDINLQSSETLDQSRFQPWITQGVTLNVSGSVSAATPGTGIGDGHGSIISASGFNPNWIPGTSITIDSGKSQPGTLVRYISSTQIEIQEDLGVVASATIRVVGPLVSGKPLPYVWGPYGAGQGGLYFFGCGDGAQPGVLSWTVGNDPDSQALTGSLEITDPSEPLQNGCIYNGRSYVWSSERMWEITPDLTNAGQFVAQVIPGAKGLFANWCLASGDYIYFRAKDGIYKSAGGLPESITDSDLYPLFEHDGQPGYTIFLPNPEDFNTPIELNPPDPNLLANQRLTYGDSELRYDYTEANTGLNKTLVFAKFPNQSGMTQGWVQDSFISIGGYTFGWWEKGTTLAGVSTPAHSLLIGVGNKLFQFTGVSDNGADIICAIQTGAGDLGDERSYKAIGDATIEANPNSATVNYKLLGTNNASVLASGTLTNTGLRSSTIFSVPAYTLSRTVGSWLKWTAASQTVELYLGTFYYVPKPELISQRATDWTDDGLNGSKYLKAVIIEADVGIVATLTDLIIDGSNNLKISSGTRNFTSADLGSVVVITAGLNWSQDSYVITSISGTAAILDHSPGATGLTGGTGNVSGNRTVQIQFDGGATAAAFQLAGPGQYELPYVIPKPVVCREMRIVPTGSGTCRIFSARWIWDPYPEFLPQIEDYNLDKWPSNKYVRGVAIEGDSQGVPVSFNAQYDGGTNLSLGSITQQGRTLTVIGFSNPFIASEIRLVPLGNWRRHSVRWIFDDYPDFAQLITPWSDSGDPGQKYIRGAIVKADTGGSTVSVSFWVDGSASGQSANLTLSGQLETIVTFNPPILGTLFRWVPGGNWRYWSTQLIYDKYPYLSPLITGWSNGGSGGPKYIRGLRLTADTNSVPVTLPVQYDGTNSTTITATHPGKTTKFYAFNNPPALPFVAYLLRFTPSGNIRIFEEETSWIFDPYPDLGPAASSIMDLGTPGAKFIQGIRLCSDTAGLPVSFNVYADGVQVAVIGPLSFTGKTVIPWSFNPPFIAHEVQLYPQGSARLFDSDTQWVWEPSPELATNWQTQPTDHDLMGFHYLRDCWIAYQSAYNATVPETLTISTDTLTLQYQLPVSPNYTRIYLQLNPQKARYRSYQISSVLGCRVFVKDTIVRVKPWNAGGTSNQYSSFNRFSPFGDYSRTNGGATI